ncbi:MAG: restriction endonuclease subunit S [Empedobacter falsenii]|uniref:Type I restriction enzyme, S subunit n=1 Tax=Myroides marinus TaxID=703342 RepID=A0A1H6WC58_9FLAO|nr:restriction endonuclease subunit S [Myroides marinus]SEJ13296.1 type I restriction enzyme, S subunit [Myroides marinus]
MEQNKKVPSIRFKGFEDECVFKVLDSIAYFYKGKEHSWKDIDEKGIYKVILYGNLYTNYGMIISDVILKTNYISEKTFFGKKNDVLIPSSDTTPIGIARASSLEIDNVILGGDINIIRPIGIDGNYLSLNLNSNKNKLISLIKGSTVRHIDNSDLKKIDLYISDSIIEQTKIGNFFKTIDDQINAQEQKHQKLVNLKKAMLEKMFPKEGADVPEIRFKGFTEKWKEKKLGDFGNVAMNKRIFKSETSIIGEIPFYKIGTFGSIPDSYITREKFLEYKSKYHYPQKGDVLISASGSIGRLVVYQGKEEYFQDSNIVWLNHGGKLNNKFLKQFYLIVKWNGLEGSTIKRLYNSNILSTNISVPRVEEQQKIGEYFEKLDNLIEQSQEQIKKIKNIKQALLQKMFV